MWIDEWFSHLRYWKVLFFIKFNKHLITLKSVITTLDYNTTTLRRTFVIFLVFCVCLYIYISMLTTNMKTHQRSSKLSTMRFSAWFVLLVLVFSCCCEARFVNTGVRERRSEVGNGMVRVLMDLKRRLQYKKLYFESKRASPGGPDPQHHSKNG